MTEPDAPQPAKRVPDITPDPSTARSIQGGSGTPVRDPTTEPPAGPKSKKKVLWIAGGVSAGVLALCCGIGAGALNSRSSGPSQPAPTKTTTHSSTTPQTTAPVQSTVPTTTTPVASKTTTPLTTTTAAPPPVQDVYYANCAAVKAAGAAPLYRGQPGYRSGLDRDGDGIACES